MTAPRTTSYWRGRLPHWEVEDGTYFITIHLAGAIPKQAALRIREISDRLGESNEAEYYRLHRQVFRSMEAWLDAVPHVRDLENPEIAAMVMDAIEHRSSSGQWIMYEYVVMPNHVHAFLKPAGSLKSVLRAFKRWTGHHASKLMTLDRRRFWQVEWFDHWSRSGRESDRIIRYIRNNPVKAGLVADYEDWPYGSWARNRTAAGDARLVSPAG